MKNAKNIILAVTGGIAAYKSADLIRRLQDYGSRVQVVMTESAKQFITPLTLQALSGHRVRDQLFDHEAELGMGHIELARWADAIVIAPASANILAKLAQGQADDLITTLCLATEAPIFVAPSMNQQMWQHAAVQANLQVLEERAVICLGPDSGEQACGEVGAGRMLEPLALAQAIHEFFNPAVLSKKRIVITAGPTREAIDPVRYISNRSSGKMGFALAEAAFSLGAEVILISGPVVLETPKGITRIDVESAGEMLAAVEAQACDIFIAVAAVADYKVKTIESQKLKKHANELDLSLIRNVDILQSIAERPDKPYCVGFCLETENLLEQAEKKLIEKNLDMIVANAVSENTGFAVDTNQVFVLTKHNQTEFALSDKYSIARKIMAMIVEEIKE